MNTYIISMGSNINPQENMEKAVALLTERFAVSARSDFLVTTPEGFTEQEDFLNGCVKITTALTSPKLKEELLKIEAELQRVRTENKNGPRTIDLDISTCNGEIIDSDYEKYWFVKKTVDQLLYR